MSPYIFKALGLNKETFADLASLVPADALDEPTGPDRFTSRFALAHWADWEAIHLFRIKEALAYDVPEVPDVDENKRAIEAGYETWTTKQCEELFASGREALLETGTNLTPDQLARELIHSGIGKVSVAGYYAHILGHDCYHIEQLAGVATKARSRDD